MRRSSRIRIKDDGSESDDPNSANVQWPKRVHHRCIGFYWKSVAIQIVELLFGNQTDLHFDEV